MKEEIPDYIFKKVEQLEMVPEKLVFKSEEAAKAFYRRYGPLLVERGVLTRAQLKGLLDKH